jgi:hypothetical protein
VRREREATPFGVVVVVVVGVEVEVEEEELEDAPEACWSCWSTLCRLAMSVP